MFVFCGRLEMKRAREIALRQRKRVLVLHAKEIVESMATKSIVVTSDGVVCNLEPCPLFASATIT